MSRKYRPYRVYFTDQPTSYYASSAVSEKAAIRQAREAAKGLGRGGLLQVARVVNMEQPEKSDPRVAGWSVGKTGIGDETGTFHLIVSELKGAFLVSRAACTATRRTAGLVEMKPPYGQKCRTCAKIAAKIAAGAQLDSFQVSEGGAVKCSM